MDIKRKKKEKRIQLIGGLIGICVAVVSLFYFFHVEKTEAEKRMVEIVNYVKVQCSTCLLYTSYDHFTSGILHRGSTACDCRDHTAECTGFRGRKRDPEHCPCIMEIH